jgi:hypothetical protein
LTFSRRQQRTEQEHMTPERILKLAARPDGLRVSWRYRDEWLHARCKKLGLRVKRGRGETTYFPPKEPESG